MKSTKELLAAKRLGAEWTSEEVSNFVIGVVNGSVSGSQAAAFLMASCINGLSYNETAALTNAMASSGVSIPRRFVSKPMIDKHSTGGVGDKVSLLLAPLAVACGLAVPMISGRGLGHTGGTVDKLDSIKGFNTVLPHTDLMGLLTNHSLFMAAQSSELAPADRILYQLRDVTGTVENTGLITASILSKKIAEGLDGLVMDVKVGSAAFMETLSEAHTLARSLQDVGSTAGLPVTVVFSRMDRPLGDTIGNWLEVVEAETALANRESAHPDLVEVTIELVAQMCVLAGTTIENARELVVDIWDSGRGHSEFHRMIEEQGGDWQASLEQRSSDAEVNVYAPSSGYMGPIDARTVAHWVIDAGGGRLVEDDEIAHGAGILFHVRYGDEVCKGIPVATVLAHDEVAAAKLAKRLEDAIEITTAPVKQEPSMIIDVWLPEKTT